MPKLKIIFYICSLSLLNSCNEKIVTPLDKSIRLISPNGGEEFYVGDTINVTWEWKNVSSLKISYSMDGGLNWSSVIDSVPALNNRTLWIIPNLITTKGLVEIKSIEDTSIKDISNSFFKINPNSSTLKTINLLSPNGGEEFYVGDTINIYWESQNVSWVKISYSLDGGLNWTDIVDPVNAQNDSISWIVPNSITTKGLIKIEDVDDLLINDRSNNFFKINYKPVLETLKFYPMQIGDEWRYFTTERNYGSDSTRIISTRTIKIIGDTLLANGKKYFVFWGSLWSSNDIIFRRVDSSSAVVNKYESYNGNEYPEWAFYLPDGTYWNGLDVTTGSFYIQYLNLSDEMKKFGHSGMLTYYYYIFVKEIGLAHYHKFDKTILKLYDTYLEYAKINGIEYGDTLPN